MGHPVSEVVPGVLRVRDTCNVYVIRADAEAHPGAPGDRTGIAIDFGSGVVLDHLTEMGIDRLTDVLMTHHHRDQGLPLAAAAGIRIHVPPVERELFSQVDEMWRTRPVYNDDNLRQDRFSLLEPLPVTDVVPEYRTCVYGGVPVTVLPTPGHTIGSVSYVVERAGQRLGFTGDLIDGPGKVWSLAATQWSYTEELLPLEDLGLGTDGMVARVAPYLSAVPAARTARFTVSLRNPTREDQKASVKPVLPRGWRAQPDVAVVPLAAGGGADVEFDVVVGDAPQRRARVGVDVRTGDPHLGQHAEALADVVDVVDAG